MNNVIVILNYNDYENCKEILQRIYNYKVLSHIVVVDNYSTDNSYSKLKEFENEKISVIKADKNGGYAYGNNFGVLYAIKNFQNIDNIIISNPDVIFNENDITEMEKAFSVDENIALVGSVVHTLDGEIDKCFAWNRFDYDLIIRPYLHIYRAIAKIVSKKRLLYSTQLLDKEEVINVATVHGCFFMVKLNDFIKAGLFDERTFLYSEEDILSFRLMKIGKSECVATHTKVIHKGSGTIGKNIKEKKKINRYSYESRLLYLTEYLHVSKIQLFLYKFLIKLNRVL